MFSIQTLQKYTRDYLFDKFRNEYIHLQQRPSSRHSIPHHVPQGVSQIGPIPHSSRPILAIDTAPHPAAVHRHPSLSVPRDLYGGPGPVTRPLSDTMTPGVSTRGPASSWSPHVSCGNIANLPGFRIQQATYQEDHCGMQFLPV